MVTDLPIPIRKGKAKSILESSVDSALLAIEIYNKPRTTFRSEGYISMMVIAWTKLFHAYFQATIGAKYYYKNPNGRFKKKDGEKLAWELSTCIRKYGKLSEAVKMNIKFFIRLRNKIEHRHINKKEVDVSIFGECQAFLFNYENFLVALFGEGYALHESLVFALQFSHMRSCQQIMANKSALAKDVQDIKKFIDDYRNSLPDEVFIAPEFSIKLLAMPKVSNTKRGDLAIDFVQLSQLSPEDQRTYDQVTALIKDKKIKVEGCNIGKLKPGGVCKTVNNRLGKRLITTVHHSWIVRIFNIRPRGSAEDPFETDTRFCHYDEAHKDYLYNDSWVDFLVSAFQEDKLTIDDMRRARYSDSKQCMNIDDFI
ncbi:hypothetical protein BerOc1_01612 [Pseudodesulfovibrio hydrargyri]|uniref:DUF3644 domain-containing protein n=1 Tax=Pseudodesulfovibrio hydrargyri TaxID=2125990 RepID=A0A1J5N8S1_9BACT|nr:DUF3644 domain-containing protein [Pseudodesulfovibrio hydrargyri]OIQ49687.1 hypothetical protein BerOc1_01612 [Pseudodesulfovibrio hydrargyri]